MKQRDFLVNQVFMILFLVQLVQFEIDKISKILLQLLSHYWTSYEHILDICKDNFVFNLHIPLGWIICKYSLEDFCLYF